MANKVSRAKTINFQLKIKTGIAPPPMGNSFAVKYKKQYEDLLNMQEGGSSEFPTEANSIINSLKNSVKKLHPERVFLVRQVNNKTSMIWRMEDKKVKKRGPYNKTDRVIGNRYGTFKNGEKVSGPKAKKSGKG